MAYSCNTCGIVSGDLDDFKRHYDSDVHQENVRRRVAGLPPVSLAAFRRRQNRSEAASASAASRTAYVCTVCDKRFGTVQTLRTHLQSAKHKARKAAQEKRGTPASAASGAPASPASEGSPAVPAAAAEAPAAPAAAEAPAAAAAAPAAGRSEDGFWGRECPEPVRRLKEREDLQAGDCLFSSQRFASVDDALCYMALRYGFDLPRFDEIEDLSGLLAYLARKVNGCMCLVCGDKRAFESRKAAQEHMLGVGHSMIRLDDYEYSEFYQHLPSADAVPAGERLERFRQQETGVMVLPSGRRLAPQHAPPQHPRREQAEEEAPQRRLMIEARAAHLTPDQMVRYQALRAPQKGYQGKKLRQEERQHHREAEKKLMQQGVSSNRFHRKGYQGDFVGRTM
eukprot:TRINITY_DN50621_c0_g1_i1.p1 TRINITY_DN50621_c0_g1~~TRINITY_DN50621_c0_g1_i1.p1  ORF type:complete len:424 (+),score=159.01 TRINITY_DN50621_c0_g1_i1:86-1273(+)